MQAWRCGKLLRWAHLAEDDPCVSAVALCVLPALQQHERARLHGLVPAQTLTQALPVQGKERQWHLQGFVPQPERRPAKTRTHTTTRASVSTAKYICHPWPEMTKELNLSWEPH